MLGLGGLMCAVALMLCCSVFNVAWLDVTWGPPCPMLFPLFSGAALAPERILGYLDV